MSEPVISYHEDGKYKSLYKGHIRELGSEIEWIRSTNNTVLFTLDFDEEVLLKSKDRFRSGDELEPISDEHASIARMYGLERKYEEQLISELRGSHFFKGTAIVAERDEIYDQNRNYRFSVFGSEFETQKLEIVIRKGECNNCSFYAGGKYSISIEISIERSEWVEVHEMISGGKKIELSVEAVDPDFYAEWSPEVNEGRLIKFYNRPLLEPDDLPLPDHMRRQGVMNLEFSLMERRSLKTSDNQTLTRAEPMNLEQMQILIENQSLLNAQLVKVVDAITTAAKGISRAVLFLAGLLALVLLILLIN